MRPMHSLDILCCNNRIHARGGHVKRASAPTPQDRLSIGRSPKHALGNSDHGSLFTKGFIKMRSQTRPVFGPEPNIAVHDDCFDPILHRLQQF